MDKAEATTVNKILDERDEARAALAEARQDLERLGEPPTPDDDRTREAYASWYPYVYRWVQDEKARREQAEARVEQLRKALGAFDVQAARDHLTKPHHGSIAHVHEHRTEYFLGDALDCIDGRPRPPRLRGRASEGADVIPVDQTTFGTEASYVEGQPPGNCLQACVASIFEIELEGVPHFANTGPLDDDRLWWWSLMGWVHAMLDRDTVCVPRQDFRDELPMAGYHVLSGPSPRGDFQHSVVALNGVIAHDPHPSRAGLAGPAVDAFVFVPRAGTPPPSEEET